MANTPLSAGEIVCGLRATAKSKTGVLMGTTEQIRPRREATGKVETTAPPPARRRETRQPGEEPTPESEPSLPLLDPGSRR